MLKEERQQHILNELYQAGKIVVNDICDKYQISPDTARRDLNELEEQGVLKRVFGGAIPYKMPVAGIDKRNTIQKNEKYLIARKALSLIKGESLIAIDGGSTNRMLSTLFPLSISLHVVTNSFPVAEELRKRPKIEVTFIGGVMDKGSLTTVGDIAIRQMQRFHFDQCFVGVSGLDSEKGMCVPIPFENEAGIKQQMISCSDEVIAMCGIHKLDKTLSYKVCDLDEIDKIVCEYPVNEQLMRKYRNKII